jgi:prepilin-type N-terminal cleavage/methylation domain-containing protein
MKAQRGFTLIELAIVLVIVTILIGGLAVPLSAQIQARRIAETKQTLQEARDALVGYAMITSTATGGEPFLPCPDAEGDGRSDVDGSGECTANSGGVSYGWFPWVTLGTAPHDAWGNRLRYVVISQFAKSSVGFSGTTPSGTLINICDTRTCSSTVAESVAFALISHGPNGWGALNVNDTMLTDSSGADEFHNTKANLPVVSRTPTNAASASGEFDDLVNWLSLTTLMSRACPDGCPSP